MKLTPLVTLALPLLVLSQASASFQPSYATVNGTFYDLNAATANPDFQAFDLGTFDTGTDQLLLGAEMNITGINVEYSRIGWGIRDSGNNLVAGFTETAGTYDSTNGGNDRWLVTGVDRPNLLSGLSNGDYTLAVYLHGKYNGGSAFFENNGGADFIADFSVVPEPGSFALISGLLGLTFVALRRRAHAQS